MLCWYPHLLQAPYWIQPTWLFFLVVVDVYISLVGHRRGNFGLWVGCFQLVGCHIHPRELIKYTTSYYLLPRFSFNTARRFVSLLPQLLTFCFLGISSWTRAFCQGTNGWSYNLTGSWNNKMILRHFCVLCKTTQLYLHATIKILNLTKIWLHDHLLTNPLK
jgi:hypothetical protein